jgi:penicillin amidase
VRRLRRILVWSFAGLLLFLGVVYGAGFLWLRTSLPQVDGEIFLAGIDAPVTIARNRYGLVTIRAQSDADAYFALGFVHAQDRLFQMEFMRRLGSGRMSETIGDITLETDRYMRILGFRRLAEAQLPVLSPELRDVLDHYANGVNAYLDSHPGARPPEFYAARLQSDPWQPADSLIWGRLMSMQLSDNWRSEYQRARLAQILSKDQLEFLWPTADSYGEAARPDDGQSQLANIEPIPRVPHGLEPLAGASNAWAVGPARSASGGALLAGDPHLGLQVPVYWYLVRIEMPDRVLEGATAPGVPLIIIGHNEQVAWSFTTTHGDNQDLFLETLDPADPSRYLTPEGTQPFETRDEIILARDAEVPLVVRQTRHGPVISDTMQVEGLGDGETVVALAWACLEEDDRTPEALFRMNRARNAEEFRSALDLFHCPLQTIVYADIHGTIGMVAAGRIPVRRALSAGSQMPADGASGNFDWLGYLDTGDLPQVIDPPRGWIATANDRIVDDSYPHFIAARWEPPYRIDRINEVLAGDHPFTIDDMSTLQMDTLSLAAQALVPLMTARIAERIEGENERRALDLLETWDGTTDRELAAPLIYNAWVRAVQPAVFGDELGALFEDFRWWNVPMLARVLDGDETTELWCDDVTTAALESCTDVLHGAFLETLEMLETAYGNDPAQWRWGDAHRATFRHPIWSRVPIIGDLISPEIATPGDHSTINRGSSVPDDDGTGFDHVHGAGLRFAIDLADPAGARFMIAGGQSGNIFSPHYDDLIGLWRDGRFLSIVAEPVSILTLAPADHD